MNLSFLIFLFFFRTEVCLSLSRNAFFEQILNSVKRIENQVGDLQSTSYVVAPIRHGGTVNLPKNIVVKNRSELDRFQEILLRTEPSKSKYIPRYSSLMENGIGSSIGHFGGENTIRKSRPHLRRFLNPKLLMEQLQGHKDISENQNSNVNQNIMESIRKPSNMNPFGKQYGGRTLFLPDRLKSMKNNNINENTNLNTNTNTNTNTNNNKMIDPLLRDFI